MWIYMLIGMNASALCLLLIVISKQFFASHAQTKTREQLAELAKQNQTTEQQLRENLLIHLSNLQQTIS